MLLKDYWPRFIRSLVEFNQIAVAEQPEFDRALINVREAGDDFFIVTLSEYGCRRWETIMGIIPDPGDTLEQRRDRILFRYLDHIPYTYRTLIRYLSTVCEDYTVELDENNYRLSIEIQAEGNFQRDALMAVLVQMIPVNLLLRIKTYIPQKNDPAKVAVCSAMAVMNRFDHTPAV